MNRFTIDHAAVWWFSLTHGFVDLASAFVVYNAAIVHGLPPAKAVAFTIMYDLLAFAIQPLAGLLIDYGKGARIAVVMGIAFTAAGVICMRLNAPAGIVAAGIGNAIFHVGAGAQVLGRYPNTAAAIGIFVGPGAIGLNAGFWFGSRGVFPFWVLIIGLFVAFVGCASLPALKKKTASTGISSTVSRPCAVLLLLAAIAVRGFVGRMGFAELHSGALAIIGLGAAACIGKMVGGGIADRFGWGRAAIAALVLASIGIVFVHAHIGVALITMVLFQSTMPVTLAATSAALPGKPAFAFGLTCLALVTGTLSAYCAPKSFAQVPVILALVAGSGAFIIAALWRMGCIANRYGTLPSPYRNFA